MPKKKAKKKVLTPLEAAIERRAAFLKGLEAKRKSLREDAR